MSNSKQDVNSYSPEGRIYQIEYAMQAMNLGTTTIGLVTSDGVVLCSEKKVISKLQISETIRKHYKIYDHIALAFSGISGDAKTIVSKSMECCLNHTQIYNENIPVEGLLKHLCQLALKFSEKDMYKKIFSRPFGASILVAGFDTEPKLYSIDPSGSYYRYKAKAIGSAYEAVETELKTVYNTIESSDDAIKKGLGILKGVMKDPLDKENVEVCVVKDKSINFLSSDEIQNYIE
ncbi:subunit alpha type-5 of proteaseome [Hamiltosporidium tvaerminnensis]|uniref:Proteasome subunit alpha type n=2 Tax=Hamiltosporidium TaxID=1176354 RepID=A0A4Q9LIX1_9MICR|nr:Proteasome subunit alpha type-5 [Hamiltosporidium tvaerminnensis]TBU07208.1 subunit alpha type-5 of proteaseome [Hamiltosporidium magnivora]TBU02990.1 subunit alpha type-5 of proteaseome [Hamiltosporidium tvaerminnensis]TBU07776.1 subunit alpha type-5 of proteaseome [Hamiltosporidium magnivora]TBU08179.1 subunit alpha type-5 of proteasome [Hamiltosporidium magnivora]